jgi:hypothetical protein
VAVLPQNPTATSARVLVWIEVIDFVPVTEIINVPTTATVGTQIYLGNSIVIPNNATYQYTTWSIADTGTTGAFLTGTRLNTTAPGTVVVTGTVKEGTAFHEDYTQDFAIEITPLSINEPISALGMIHVYPNPTTGELRVTSYELPVTGVEIFDVYSRKLLSLASQMSLETTIDISHFPAGAYFVKVITEQGEIVKKVVKQ